ncbi:hypothetical protein LTR17_011393 [Elasticomyces elasticus]|nr:hypothetical protein LTR17_011393 [Elasticomyces elasticus]
MLQTWLVKPGTPAPSPEPMDSKFYFTTEDDALLVELKKTKNIVRYCTKLKAKTSIWTNNMLNGNTAASAAETDPGEDVRPLACCCLFQRLRIAVEEYEADRWRVVSDKVGNGFSTMACREKAVVLVQADVAVPSAKANKATETCKQVGHENSGNCHYTSSSQKNTTCIPEAKSEVLDTECW